MSDLLDHENFIHTKFGYCYYSICDHPYIFNLYVEPEYRRLGHSKKLLEYAIKEVRKYCDGDIRVCVEPREESIDSSSLSAYYKKMGLKVEEDLR